MRRQKNSHFFMLLSFSAVLFLSACSEKTDSQSWEGPEGEIIRWEPSFPQIGDLVFLEASIPSNPSKTAESFPESDFLLFDPTGEGVAFLRSEFFQSGSVESSENRKKIFWSFRIKKEGPWIWKKKQILFTAPTVAGESTELKTIDSQTLWVGGKLQVAPEVATPEVATPEGLP